MKLSAEMFNEIVSSLKSDDTCTRGHEKRTQARVGLRCALEITPVVFSDKKTKPILVHVHDISKSGIGLVSAAKLEESSEFIANLSRDGHPPVPILYKVRYCRRLSNELWSIGGLLQRVLPDCDGEVHSFGKKPKPAKTKTPSPATGTATAI